jgi:hypothetical protein
LLRKNVRESGNLTMKFFGNSTICALKPPKYFLKILLDWISFLRNGVITKLKSYMKWKFCRYDHNVSTKLVFFLTLHSSLFVTPFKFPSYLLLCTLRGWSSFFHRKYDLCNSLPLAPSFSPFLFARLLLYSYSHISKAPIT